ncbi:MAG: hypothetical protein ACD_79C01009G0003 [uncultured bacterium]|nr:MAG: hypothetical protein ACD_79C01009G0003 [uncultured bacterium]
MNNVVVDIADMKYSNDPNDVVVTYSLGSCLGLSIYDPVTKIGGIIHCMLPLSKIDPRKAQERPFMFTDTGLPLFLQSLLSNGAKKSNLIVKIAGCSRIMDDKQLFNIGERNHTVARKILWKNDILISSEDVGGTCSRTIFLHIDTGKTFLRISGNLTEL